jgi:hypothetical protein
MQQGLHRCLNTAGFCEPADLACLGFKGREPLQHRQLLQPLCRKPGHHVTQHKLQDSQPAAWAQGGGLAAAQYGLAALQGGEG